MKDDDALSFLVAMTVRAIVVIAFLTLAVRHLFALMRVTASMIDSWLKRWYER